jgi:hypothetical protein
VAQVCERCKIGPLRVNEMCQFNPDGDTGMTGGVPSGETLAIQ